MQQTEKEFIKKLEAQAEEQRKLLETTITPSRLQWFVVYLAENPWRIILPLSIGMYLFLWICFGDAWPQTVLALFGKNL